ncbi:MAG: hypothetical protein J6N56_04990 [Bacteroidales bacterium]|nr:hypothetical protein [Bacteroidales bacterium]
MLEGTGNRAEVLTWNIDVVYLAGLYCKVMDKARIFLGKETNNLFAVKKDVENNYASVYAQTQYENSLNFYMWTDKDKYHEIVFEWDGHTFNIR